MVVLFKVLGLSDTLTDLSSFAGDLAHERVVKRTDRALAAGQSVREPNDMSEAIFSNIKELLSVVIVCTDVLDCDDE